METDRRAVARRGRRLEYFTIGWNSLEGVIALSSGAAAGSISLVGFGVDSFIEVLSGGTLLIRMAVDADEHRRERIERMALRTVGGCFLGLAVYIGYDAVTDLWFSRAPEPSLPGLLLAIASLIVMPILAHAKRGVGGRLNSAAMQADARQTDFCTYLSAILLGGLLLNAMWGLWWADPVAALVMTPFIAKEGVDAWRGDACCD